MKKILKNALYLFFGNIGIRIITAISTILLARHIGPTDYGVFSIAIAISMITGYFTDAGLSNTFMREVTKKNSNISVLISSYLKVRIIFGLIATIIAYFYITISYDDAYFKSIIGWIVYPTIIGMCFMGVGITFFQAKERMGIGSLISVIQGALSSLALFLGIIYHLPLISVAKLYGSSFIIAGLFSMILVVKHTNITNKWDKGILNQLFVFTINGIIIIILPQLGPIVLEKVSTITIVGYFSTAYKIPAVLYQIPGVIATAFYPRLFSFGNNSDFKNHRDLSNIELKMMSFIGIAISLPFLIEPKFWIVSLLGIEWIRASDALSILSFMVILQAINYPLADYLTTIGQQFKRTIVMFFGLAVSVIAYIYFGTYYGLIGGALAAIITELILFIGYSYFIPRSFLFLFKGVRFNLLSFIIVLAFNKVIPINSELLNMILITSFYIILVIIFDRKLLKELLNIVKRKNNILSSKSN